MAAPRKAGVWRNPHMSAWARMAASTDEQPACMMQVHAMVPSIFTTAAFAAVEPMSIPSQPRHYPALSTNQVDPACIEVHAQRLARLRQFLCRHAHLVDLPLQARGRIGARHVQQHQTLKT